ncbi:hypothetical protein CHARACLAT_017004 [Characodon lateralis]|uniref:Uncharacterized protein n=1 Tax=Characodon lateralis TaxID=208331 RepID=A0ABU7F6Y5_9TELE|nr:hypothetical protein [Characodon lateralis]
MMLNTLPSSDVGSSHTAPCLEKTKPLKPTAKHGGGDACLNNLQSPTWSKVGHHQDTHPELNSRVLKWPSQSPDFNLTNVCKLKQRLLEEWIKVPPQQAEDSDL